MVKALFDTNILIDFFNGAREAHEELARYDDLGISIVTWMEVMVGAAPATADATKAVLSRFRVVPLDDLVAIEAVELLRRHRMKLPDAIIWASARIEHRLLVTRNEKDFPVSDPGVRAPYRL